MIQGPSGILTIAPPWNRPRFEPSKRRLTWPNGAIAICLSADQPERARGLQFDRLWCDELCAWQYPQRMWETVLLCLRLGEQPRAVVTTTPKPIKLLERLLGDPTTRLSKETTFANARHLAPEFISEITAMYQGTRLGRQELEAEVLDTSETVRFPSLQPGPARRGAGRVRPRPARPPGHRLRPVAGTSAPCGSRSASATAPPRAASAASSPSSPTTTPSTGPPPTTPWPSCSGRTRSAAAASISVYLDPASTARSGVGPAARGEFARVLGERITAPGRPIASSRASTRSRSSWAHRPASPISGSTPGASFLIESFKTYRRAEQRGEILDTPADPQHPAEEAIDALRARSAPRSRGPDRAGRANHNFQTGRLRETNACQSPAPWHPAGREWPPGAGGGVMNRGGRTRHLERTLMMMYTIRSASGW